jgi:ArsR family transcriptional regulator, arsenate/arsenite/antimonite-responsive transcriptional repressor
MSIELSSSDEASAMSTTETTISYDIMAKKLKVLADPRRLQILDLLIDGVQCNCEIGDHLDMAPNLISHHIGVLRKAGLVNAERDPVDARWIYYSINESELATISHLFGEFFNPERIQPRRPECGPRTIQITS